LEGNKVALVDIDQRLHLRVVEPIFGDDQFYYVTSGLTNGDEIITSAMGVPIEGMKVSPEKDLDDNQSEEVISQVESPLSTLDGAINDAK